MDPKPQPDGAGDRKEGKARPTQKEVLKRFQDRFHDSLLDGSKLQFIKELGEGAFAIVSKCRLETEQDCEIVAVKELKPATFRSERDVDDFFAETNLLQNLHHPSIVQFKGVAIQVGRNKKHCMAVVQEHMNMGSLRDMILKQMHFTHHKSYSQKTALQWMLQVAQGLKYLHGLKATVIHRDLKPENILLTCEGDIKAKIVDFGLSALVRKPELPQEPAENGIGHSALDTSQALDTSVRLSSYRRLGADKSQGNKQGQKLTRAGSNLFRRITIVQSVLDQAAQESAVNKETGPARAMVDAELHNLSGRTGSLMYMAPEVLRSEQYNEKVDTYSFGVILYEVLSGFKIIYMILNPNVAIMPQVQEYTSNVAKGYRPPIPEEWPDDIAGLIDDCWAMEPYDRPSMEEVVERLEEILGHERYAPKPIWQTLLAECCPIQ